MLLFRRRDCPCTLAAGYDVRNVGVQWLVVAAFLVTAACAGEPSSESDPGDWVNLEDESDRTIEHEATDMRPDMPFEDPRVEDMRPPEPAVVSDGDTDRDGIVDAEDSCETIPETYNGRLDDDGCPDGSQSIVIIEDEIVLLDPIEFAPGTAELMGSHNDTSLDLVALIIERLVGERPVRIESHSTEIEDDDANLVLTRARADVVRLELIARGVPEVSLSAVGLGAAVPRCRSENAWEENEDPDCSPLNARIEFKIMN